MWHLSKRPWQFQAWLLVVLVAVFLAVWQAPPNHAFEGLANYLPLHAVFETFSFVVSFMVFGVVWNAYSGDRAGNLVILACAFLAVGLIDFLHALSYKGMPLFVTPGDPEKAINFWLMARYIAAGALLLVGLRHWRPLARPGQRYAWLAGALALTALAGWAGLFHQDALPRTFVEGRGLTPFKIGAEYVLVALFAGAAATFFVHARRGASYDAMSLFTAASVSILSELCFTLYSDVTDVFNLLGHVYKVIAYGFIYHAVFVESVRAPFRQVQKAEASLREREQDLSAILENLPLIVFTKDALNLRFVSVNSAAEKLFGIPREQMLGKSDRDFFPPEQADFFAANDEETLERGETVDIPEEPIDTPKGRRLLHTRKVVIPGPDGNPRYLLGISEDITERKHAEETIHRLAYTDGVTGLPNRVSFGDHAQQAVRSAQEHGHSLALLLMDLEHFREVNDTLGHSRGDTLLHHVGARLRSALFTADVIARLGGDEFGILLTRLASSDDVERVVEKLQNALKEPFMIDGVPIVVEAAIGVAVMSDEASDADTALRRADIAMYHAKRMATGYAVYKPEYDRHSPQQLRLMAELHDAIEQGQLLLEFQPKMEIATGQVVGTEALVRWQHPHQGRIMPDNFIGTAEHTGLITPLTQWVLTNALDQCESARREGIDLRVSVNLSARSLHDPHLQEMVERALQSSGVRPSQLILEITESAIMLDPNSAAEILATLNRMGVWLSIDDFGTGYTSLDRLRSLPVNEVKIDKSFIDGMLTNKSDAMIVQSVIELGHILGLRVVAEGVETQEILTALADFGCDEAQGYLINRPQPWSALKSWFQATQVEGRGEGR